MDPWTSELMVFYQRAESDELRAASTHVRSVVVNTDGRQKIHE